MNDKAILTDLEAAWAELDQRVATDFTRMEAITSALAEAHTRRLLRRSIWLPACELAVTLAGTILVILGIFQTGGPVYYGSLVGILILFAALIASAIWQIATLARLDAAAPVLATQRQLARVRTLRIFQTRWVLLLSPVLWAPFLVALVEVPLRLFTDVEPPIFTSWFLVVNLLIGLLLTLGLFFLSRWLTTRLQGTSFLRSLLDDFAGRRLTAARTFLARLHGFESE